MTTALDEALAALAAVPGLDLRTSEAELLPGTADKSGHRSAGLPAVRVEAHSIEDVQAVLRIATEYRVPVVTRGAGSGLAGGAVAGPGEIFLSTLSMNRVLEINHADQLAVVEPGIINGDFNRQILAEGYWFAPDPASRDISTVGGNIATGAGGLLCAKYGVTRDAVLALAVVLADGRLIRTGHRSVKGVTGLDLTALMVGSEGLLGVIVEATVRIRPVTPGEVHTVAATFPSATSAAAASSAITAAGLVPAIMELMDARCLAAAHRILDLPAPAADAAHLILQFDGIGSAREAADSLDVLRAQGGHAELAATPEEGEHLLAVRRAMHPAMETLGTPLIEDVSVPRSRLAEMFEIIADIEQRYGVEIPTVAHAGDGNLHPNFIVQGDEVPDHVWEAAGEMFTGALALGGTLTGEHGVGLLKRRWLGDELGADQLELQRQIAAVFDPLGILNPGKVF